jgi:hypothetical protein
MKKQENYVGKTVPCSYDVKWEKCNIHSEKTSMLFLYCVIWIEDEFSFVDSVRYLPGIDVYFLKKMDVFSL